MATKRSQGTSSNAAASAAATATKPLVSRQPSYQYSTQQHYNEMNNFHDPSAANDTADNYHSSGGGSGYQPIEIKRVPTDQLQVTPEQLLEVYTHRLTSTNPHLQNQQLALYDYSVGEYKVRSDLNQMSIHYDMDSNLVHRDSEEGYQTYQEIQSSTLNEKSKAHLLSQQQAQTSQKVSTSTGTTTAAGDLTEDDDDEEQSYGDVENLKNQFHYNNRGIQTLLPTTRDKSIQTVPPPTLALSGQVNHHLIYDLYYQEVDAQYVNNKKLERQHTIATTGAGGAEKSSDAVASGSNGMTAEDLIFQSTVSPISTTSASAATTSASSQQNTTHILQSTELLHALKVVERLIQHNVDEQLYMDLKYYENTNELNKQLTTTMIPTAEVTKQYGSFLPLWRLGGANRLGLSSLSVTSLQWNYQYNDLMAVSYGSYEFIQSNSSGCITIYSLKNPHYPEVIYSVPNTGILCLAFHPYYTSLLLAGYYDGSVAIYDITRSAERNPLYVSQNPQQKHYDSVWHVQWCATTELVETEETAGAKPKDAAASASTQVATHHPYYQQYVGPLQFMSIGADGRLIKWSINKNELVNEVLLELKVNAGSVSEGSNNAAPAPKTDKELNVEEEKTLEPEAPTVPAAATASTPQSLIGNASGTAFDLHPTSTNLFVIATDTGLIELYRHEFHVSVVKQFIGHTMAVYALQWNPFAPTVFISACADWSCRVWDITNKQNTAVLTLDFTAAVMCVQWAPYSSTVFATASADGLVRVYDLALNKLHPVGEWKIESQASGGLNAAANTATTAAAAANKANKPAATSRAVKLTQLVFNPVDPILLVGDEKGYTTVLKLSANLRRMSAPSIEELDLEEEKEKLIKLLIVEQRDTTAQLIRQPPAVAASAAVAAGKKTGKPKTAGKPGTAAGGDAASRGKTPGTASRLQSPGAEKRAPSAVH